MIILTGGDLAEKDWISHLLCEPSFSAEKVSFVSALGLSFYIDKEDFFTLISTLAEHLPHGSALVFDYAAISVGFLNFDRIFTISFDRVSFTS